MCNGEAREDERFFLLVQERARFLLFGRLEIQRLSLFLRPLFYRGEISLCQLEPCPAGAYRSC
ncbi:hypothetical protein KSB_20640 [Ktedonobacter robiniae]|uniref:Uncharacterized protein n=1 Tax=Ktedonobacter robiniae TaxID=2778365 RepID=A0ABQ3ULI6_9CHLR|nr:hypothetical protein KSB_20640 [Ktedonobacter robiniae]